MGSGGSGGSGERAWEEEEGQRAAEMRALISSCRGPLHWRRSALNAAAAAAAAGAAAEPLLYCSAYTETLDHRDDALLYIAYVMLIWAAPIPADR